MIGYVCQATLDPGDEVVTPWPSFPSYVLDPLKLAATPVRVPLRDGRVDVDDLLAAVTPRTKLAYLPDGEQPDGHDDRTRGLPALPGRPPPGGADGGRRGVLRVRRRPGAPRTRSRRRRSRAVTCSALRTFSKIYGLAGLRVGYGVGPADVVAAIRKVQRAFDVTTPAQEAALASLDGAAELARRRAVNRESMAALESVLRAHGFDPIGPAVGNFLFVDVGTDADALNDALLRRGVIVRPMGSFGAPTALRITAGTPEEIAFLAEQLASVFATT